MDARRWAWLAVPVALALALAAFWPALGAGFTSDDFYLLSAVRSGGPLGLWCGPHSDWFRPLISLSVYADDRLWRGGPAGFHLTNLLAHVLCALLTGGLARAACRARGEQDARATRAGALAALLFLLLPCHSEAVSWVSGRTDVLAAAFALAALAALAGAGLGPARGVLGLALLAASGLCKESVVTLPLVLAALVSGRRVESREARAGGAGRWCWAAAGVVAACLFLRRVVLGRWVAGYGAGVHFHLDPRGLAFNLIGHPVRTLLPYLPSGTLARWLPLGEAQTSLHRALGAGHGRGMVLAAAAAVAVLTLGLVLGFRLARRAPRVRFGAGATFLACYVLALLPVLPLRVSLVNTQGERFLYLPSAFLCMAAAVALARGIRSGRMLAALAAVVAVLYSAALLHQNRNWRAAGRICADAVAELGRLAPARPVLLLNLPDHLEGAYMFRNGLAEACRMQLADRAPARLRAASFHTLGAPLDRVRVAGVAGGFRLDLDDPGAVFLGGWASSLPAPESWGARSEGLGPRSVKLTLPAPEPGEVVAFFSEGRLRRLP